MGTTEKHENSFWTNVGSLGGAVIGIVLILICLLLSFWVAFVALLIPLIVIVLIAGFVMARQATPEDSEEQDLTKAGYRGQEAEYGIENESATGDPAA